MTIRNGHRLTALLCGLILSIVTGAVFAGGNLLGNPSFDHDLSGWTVLNGQAPAWSAVDAVGNIHSGSALLVNDMYPSNGFVPLALAACVTVAPSTDYSFGGRVMMPAGQPAGSTVELWAATYASGDCSGNPLVTAQEHRDTVGQWVTIVRNLTTLASVHSVRVTIGVFKPAGVTAIASAHFDDLFLQQGGGGNGFVIGPSISASWYDPAHSGHGILLEMLDGAHAWMCWFTFDLEGNRVWICAQGSARSNAIEFANAFVVEGGKFPPLFDPQKIVEVPWGSIGITFTGCNNATMTWSTATQGFQSGSMPLSRLTSLWGVACQ
jgi:hypothetical protein